MWKRKILIIHPHNKTTFFLNRIKNSLQYEFKENVHYFRVMPNEDSHKECLQRIMAHDKNGLIVFLGHGRSDKLFGAKANTYDAEISEDKLAENPDLKYYNDDFINLTNIEIFTEKKVFCLSCNSSEIIGKKAVENGATVFIGFGDVPTSTDEFKAKMEDVGDKFVARFKGELNYIVKRSLIYSINTMRTFQGLLDVISLVINQRIAETLITHKQFNRRYLLADYLYFLKKEIAIIGNGKIKLVN